MVNFQTSRGGPVSREASKENARRNIYIYIYSISRHINYFWWYFWRREGKREVGSCRVPRDWTPSEQFILSHRRYIIGSIVGRQKSTLDRETRPLFSSTLPTYNNRRLQFLFFFPPRCVPRRGWLCVREAPREYRNSRGWEEETGGSIGRKSLGWGGASALLSHGMTLEE